MAKNKKGKNKKRLKNTTKQSLKTLIWLILFVSVIGIFRTHHLMKPAEAQAPYARENNTFPIAQSKDMNPIDIFNLKTRGVSAELRDEMWQIINCESRFNPTAKSNISTAKGMAQFINKTWANYCEGDVFDPEANLDCFVRLYPKHKAWWDCHRVLALN